MKEHYQRHPERFVAYKTSMNRKMRAKRRVTRHLTPEQMDAMRRALLDAPPTIASEDGLLAYYRGFVAGAKRSGDESERFERYQDIAFRVAAELDRKTRRWDPSNRLSYEDMVSVGYEAVLEILRKQREPARSMVAQTIRSRIVDEARRRFGSASRAGGRRMLITGAFEDEEGPTGLLEGLAAQEGQDVDQAMLWERIQGLLEGAPVDGRLGAILRARLDGKKLWEVGEELGLTESRVSQLLSEARPWLEEHVLPLAESA